MSQLNQSNKKRFQQLLMAAVDDELSASDRAEFEQFVQTYPECQKEWFEYKSLKEVTNTMTLKSPPTEVWDNYWRGVYNRIERGVAWILISISCIIFLTYGGFKAVESILGDSHTTGIIKVAIILAMGGFMILFVSVIREKFFTYKSDPYKEIQR